MQVGAGPVKRLDASCHRSEAISLAAIQKAVAKPQFAIALARRNLTAPPQVSTIACGPARATKATVKTPGNARLTYGCSRVGCAVVSLGEAAVLRGGPAAIKLLRAFIQQPGCTARANLIAQARLLHPAARPLTTAKSAVQLPGIRGLTHTLLGKRPAEAAVPASVIKQVAKVHVDLGKADFVIIVLARCNAPFAQGQFTVAATTCRLPGAGGALCAIVVVRLITEPPARSAQAAVQAAILTICSIARFA